MRHYELIDQYIAENHNAVGDSYNCADVRAWFESQGIDVDASQALTAHREAGRLRDENGKHKRVFTTKRMSYGPSARFEIVEDTGSVFPKAVREMHQQIGTEAVDRWITEMQTRMAPIVHRNRRAAALLQQAATEMTLVASVFDIKLSSLLSDDELEEG